MKMRRRSLRRKGGVGRRVFGVLGLAAQPGGARFAEGETPAPAAPEPSPDAPAAVEAPAPKAPEAAEHPVHHHPAHKPHRSHLDLILGVATVGVIAAFVAGILVMRSMRPTFKELEAQLTTTAADGKRVYATLPAADFKGIVRVDPTTKDDTGIYFYPSVREGSAEIILDPNAWSRDKARILKMTLYR